MKVRRRAIATAFVSFAIGVGAAPWLHAQSRPPAFLVAEINVKDAAGYESDFLPKARANIKASGGQYLARGSGNAVFGAPPANHIVLLEFADMDALAAFEEKQRKIEGDIGVKYADFRAFSIEGVPLK